MADGQECTAIKAEQELHQRKVEAARQGMTHDAETAKSDTDMSVISFDLMKRLATPIISTGVAYYKRQLWTFCLGFMISKLASDYKVDIIDYKFLVSGHSYLPNDQDFGLIEKNKKHYKNIYVPNDWVQVVLEIKKKNPFRVVVMTSSDFFSTNELEKALTNRKKTAADEKVEWLRIQWLRYEKEKPGIIQYKYSNNEVVLFNEVNVKKRGKQTFQEMAKLLPLFGGPKSISEKKYQDLLSLLDYIPPVNHEFYRKLVHNARVEEDSDVFDDNREEENE
ncbi:unnamed protein product [Psylliodes chrysocephalus]|uniref:Uncharacterized protein n=1 Tax=Psylliodes chrysocephalus TaxID=3402493 RepID=A0A9P0D7U6_9CUCU|nr:unnamed protein product [Psylliodes chrysocephala]